MRLRPGLVPDDELQRAYRVRIALFLFGAVLVVLLSSVLFQGIQTLNRLEVVESERDRWQRPSDIIQALDLKDGNSVLDLGSGAGYFTLKLAGAVGEHGRVLAVDIQSLPLLFLRTRAFLRGQYNVSVIRAEPDDPHLSSQIVDAVLLANTYHELTNSRAILTSLSQSLVSGGRLVVVDRGPAMDRRGEREHAVSATMVEAEIRQHGFVIVSRQDAFVSPPGDEAWWLIVARKP